MFNIKKINNQVENILYGVVHEFFEEYEDFVAAQLRGKDMPHYGRKSYHLTNISKIENGDYTAAVICNSRSSYNNQNTWVDVPSMTYNVTITREMIDAYLMRSIEEIRDNYVTEDRLTNLRF